MRMVEFYFDFASPYGFLAAMQIEQMQRPVVWRPFLLGTVYQRFAQSPLEHPLKRDYVINLDAPRAARRIGLELRTPQGFPEHSLPPSRAFYWLEAQDTAKAITSAKAAYRKYWLDGCSTADAEAAADAALAMGVSRDALLAASRTRASRRD